MEIIHVEASRNYDVLIGENLLKDAGQKIRDVSAFSRAVIISDDNVYPLYMDTVRSSLEKEGIRTEAFVFPHGEASKSLPVYGQILEFLCAKAITRNDLIIALGGGVCGDLAGFAAATYQRGIRFVQIPTSLLAMVDSSVGGKTAVNLSGGKNQAGCFYQPSLVICDTLALNTLPEEEFTAGCAEVIKYGMIGDAEFFFRLKENDIKDFLTPAIARCVSMKRDIVRNDEFDTGERMLLNFGHTMGHGVEKSSDFGVPHGFAVSMGMAAITKSAERMGLCEPGTSEELNGVLKKYHLPVTIPFSHQEIIQAAVLDKKSTGSSLRLIIPEKIGKCVIRTIPAEEFAKYVELSD